MFKIIMTIIMLLWAFSLAILIITGNPIKGKVWQWISLIIMTTILLGIEPVNTQDNLFERIAIITSCIILGVVALNEYSRIGYEKDRKKIEERWRNRRNVLIWGDIQIFEEESVLLDQIDKYREEELQQLEKLYS